MQQLVCGFGYTESQSVHRQRELARKLFHESAEASLELPDAVGRIVGVENAGNAAGAVGARRSGGPGCDMGLRPADGDVEAVARR